MSTSKLDAPETELPATDAPSAVDREDQLTVLRERLNITLAAAGAAGTWNWDIPNERLYLDSRLAALYGVEKELAEQGASTETFFQSVYPADVNRIRIAVAGMLHGAEVFFKTFRIIGADGFLRWVEAHGRCHFNAEGLPERFSGILVDVTGRHRVEERLRIAQSAGGVGTFEHVPGHATAAVSQEFCSLLGLNPTSVLPVATINRLIDEGSPALLDMSHLPAEELPYTEIKVTRADDQQARWIARKGEVVRDTDHGGIRHIGVIYDITESKRAEQTLRELNDTLEQRVQEEIADRVQAEEALRQAQKMEAVGQLTGGIAHDFNNLLTVILGNVDMALRQLGSSGDERVSRALTNAHKGTERAAALTQRLLAFSRRQPLAPKKVSIARLLQGMMDLLTRSLGETIEVRTEITPDQWFVEADPNQLENALLNLAVNARDAMDGIGTLTFAAGNLPAGCTLPSGETALTDLVTISVRDTGAGMPAETIKRVFEPFFTTKEVGKGTGLGLSMVYGFVKQSGGDISVTSEVGAGTTVCLYLPRVSDSAAVQAESTAVENQPSHTTETILVVEDDEDVRQFAADSLRELGYCVLEAAGGASALTLLRERTSDVQLLVTDVIMPGLSGKELANAAAEQVAGLKVLYVSGYPRDVILRDGRVDSGVELLSKPFTQKDLAARVRELLD